MDFCQLLHKAQRNDQNSSAGARYYSTKFEPPKKIQKTTKEISVNVKKFLAKKEAEEKKRVEEAQRKKEELLALRAQDKKATRRVNVMLKRTKSANQAVIEDAVDKQHTAVTLAGPDQPDEDDYGYVSQESTALYEKLMEKYKNMPEEPKFDLTKKKVSTNLNSTKDRVKAALEKEREEALLPHRRKRKHKETENKEGNEIDEKDGDVRDIEPAKSETASKPKPKPKPAPPPMSFTDLLKIAEKKQFEPILIEQKPKEEERLLTKKQKKEAEREKEWRERKEGKLPPLPNKIDSPNKASKPVADKLKPDKSSIKPSTENIDKPPKVPNESSHAENKPASSFKKPQVPSSKSVPSSSSKPFSKNLTTVNEKLTSTSSKDAIVRDKLEKLNRETNKQRLTGEQVRSNGNKPGLVNGQSKAKEFSSKDPASRRPEPATSQTKQFPPKDLKQKKMAPEIRTKQFPPPDVRPREQFRKKPVVNNKRRIIDDDDDEYDSELDDFIDDGPEEEQNYSSYIKEIFGYDKSRYRYLDDDDADNMESTFAQQMKEEVRSAKIGISEDLEDIKKEKEEKRRKAMLKKKMK